MDINLDAIELVGFSADEKIYDSKLLDLKVPSTTFLQTGMYFVPVDGKTIHDPLFVSDGCMVVGTIVETNVYLKDRKVYKSDIEEDPSVIGKTIILQFNRRNVLSDGTHAYMVYQHLIRIDQIVILDPNDATYRMIKQFETTSGVTLYEEFLKPKLEEKPLLPMVLHRAERRYTEQRDELLRMQQEVNESQDIYSKLFSMTIKDRVRKTPMVADDVSAKMVVNRCKTIRLKALKHMKELG